MTNSSSHPARPRLRGLIGMLHLPPLPGDPLHQSSAPLPVIEERLLADARALADGGAAALLLENFGSVPFVKGVAGDRLPPHQVASMAVLARRVRDETALPLGINCLRSDAHSALGVALAAGATFIRVNVHVGATVTDQGLIEGEAAATLRYRRALGAEAIAIYADVLVKHGRPLAPTSAGELTHDTLQRGLADGVIVTGRATGGPIDLELLREVSAAAAGAPVWLGSGVRSENAAQLAPYAEAAIVGTSLKIGGRIEAPVDPARVRELVNALAPHFRRTA